jgi:hypothetical protein
MVGGWLGELHPACAGLAARRKYATAEASGVNRATESSEHCDGGVTLGERFWTDPEPIVYHCRSTRPCQFTYQRYLRGGGGACARLT